MRDLIIILLHVFVTVVRVAQPGGVRSIIAESVLLKHQLLILNRSRRRAPNLRICDRLLTSCCSLFVKPVRLAPRIALEPSTLLNFHRMLVRRKYRLLFSPKRRNKPGPKGPDSEMIRAVIEMKQRNPTWGCPRIADQINLAFGTSINKDVVRRILAQHYHPVPSNRGSSWLTFLGHMKDSLWSVDLISMRIRQIANPLGSGCDGSVHPRNYRIWDSGWSCRWSGALPHVQTGDSRCRASEILQFRSRSAVSVSPMEGEPTNS
jgi:putative transposase